MYCNPTSRERKSRSECFGFFLCLTGRARASDAKWQRGANEPFEPKRGSFFFKRRWCVSGRSNGKPPIPQTAKQRQTVSCCEAAARICGRSGCASDPKADPLLSTFPSAIFSFWERIVNFKDFGGQISHFKKKWEERKVKDGTKLGYLGWEMRSVQGWQSGGKRNA